MITFSSVQIRRGINILLDNASATINPQQKIGLVGKNGCGKSTLIALLKGEFAVDAGSVYCPPHWQMAWVNQETPALDQAAIEYVIDGDRPYRQLENALLDANHSNNGQAIALLHEQLDVIDAWTIRSRAAALLNGLGFSAMQMEQPVKDFSGGWRMRLNLAQALICRSDLLLLDEPTNHLDLDALFWLEKWLKNYKGTLVLISHDRDFLDPIVNKILHIENQSLTEYTGNYSSFELQRAEKFAQQQALYQQQQRKINHLQHYIDRFRAKATKAKQAQSRIKMLERMEHIVLAQVDNPFSFTFEDPGELPNPLITLDNVIAGYGDNIVLNAVKLNLVPGSRIGLLGRNGAGKSTLIKLLAQEISPQQGQVGLVKGVKLGYFAQHQLESLRGEESPLWHLNRLAQFNDTEQKLRNFLGGFAFKGDKVKEPVNTFSGGEKARLVLALIVWQKPNLLLLDEPTNHLDLDMRQALVEALIDYKGALVVVSHDRHLLRSVSDDFYLVHNGQVDVFDGDLDDYYTWFNEQQKKNYQQNESVGKIETLSAADRKEQKRKDAEFRKKLQPLRNSIAQLEQKIDLIQTKLKQIETALTDNTLYEKSRQSELTIILEKQRDAQKAIDEVEVNWLQLQEQLEQETAQINGNVS